MSNSASLDIQKWFNEVLRNNTGVTSLVGLRVHDQVPRSPTFPYVVIGDDQEVTESQSGLDAFSVYTNVHVFTRSVGVIECKKISAAIRDAVNEALEADQTASPTAWRALDTYTLQNIQDRDVRVFYEPEELGAKAVMTFECRVAKEP